MALTAKIRVKVKLPYVVAPGDSSLPVSIINQDSTEIASVAAGGSYGVVQFDGICDDEDLNDSTITDTGSI
jgi:hypothetical protein